jgi:FkbM family methyltransferase
MNITIYIVKFLDKFPALYKPVHALYAKYLHIKYDKIYFLITNGKYKKKYLSLSGQDRWVVEEIFNKKRGGFFLDIGAYDGFFINNTYVLEKNFDWEGICVEPSRKNFELMKNKYNRKCICINELVDGTTDEVNFIEADDDSGIVDKDTAFNETVRSKEISKSKIINKIIKLKPVTLDQLLQKYDAPKIIDYFSLDVEGAEERILKNFPFEKYIFLSITIERPTPELNKILFKNGYIFIKNSLFDSFYVHNSHPNLNTIKKYPFKQVPKKMF